MAEVNEKRAQRNRFESYPDLARWMESLANSNIEGMCLASWNDFCNSVNSALAKAEAAPEMYEALKAMLKLFGKPHQEEYVDGGASYKLAVKTVDRASAALAKAEAAQS